MRQEEIYELLLPVKEKLKTEITEFKKRPIGRFIQVAGQRVIASKIDGRGFNWADLEAMAREAAEAERRSK